MGFGKELWKSLEVHLPPVYLLSALSSGVYFALCLSLMVVSLLETVFITYLLHLATTQPPPMPWWLHSLMLRYNRKPCPSTAPQDNSKGLGHSNTHLPGKGSQLCPHHSCPLPCPPLSPRALMVQG